MRTLNLWTGLWVVLRHNICVTIKSITETQNGFMLSKILIEGI